MTWKQVQRHDIYKSPYIEVWEDEVILPSGATIDDFSGVTLPDGVLVVATDAGNNLLLFNEYKYAVNDTVLTFPAGGIDEGESPRDAAVRELLEETGYKSDDIEVLTSLYPYPSKIAHKLYIVRARNAVKVSRENHSHIENEIIGELQLVPPSKIRELRKAGKFNTSYMLAAVAIALPDNF